MSEISSPEVISSADDFAPLGLYLHVPFCASTCDFCAFYQTSPTVEGVRGFQIGIEKEMTLVTRTRPLSTVFWGGGTPGLLSARDIIRLGTLVREFNGGAAPAEWSVEMAPASVTDARLAALKEIGVTRISMGAQSFQPELLDALGRLHTREQVMRAYDRIRAADFASVNIDLMFALPGQDEAAWLADMTQAIELGPDHLSTYCLTFEEDTKLWVKLAEGKVKLDPEHEAQLYETTWERLNAAGYAQYEVANFARPGHVCRHNLNTWNMHEWIGLGPSAAGQHEGWRAANPSDLAQWQAEVARGERMTTDRVALTPELLAEDALIFGLRMTAGVDPVALARRFPSPAWTAARGVLLDLIEDELAERVDGRIRLTTRGRLLADSVGAAVMEAMDQA
ncbi:radical SAM family heme chaperone HemW [Synoicihabitans lomoniglobus]|uniref:Heme chaperone HemW n=1 Tax=Synoicihabitans lomoniglobus TaxID=2909285 RepID=A0AAF0CQY3_9BACT|nr:radical SAM family heme chaperone HemW [Opitutaceae bacterium LMO-M01]WED66413.1 radical SAM family heme chaperone HemW [Opitutaceae bacterium LMO-M01]